MTDHLTPRERSELMRRIRSTGTLPEAVVEEIIRRTRRAYRVQDETLPGTPDFSIPRIKVAVFVHGCFWHRHWCPRGKSHPSTRHSFWNAKFNVNIRRDRRMQRALRRQGWSVTVIWECQTTAKNRDRLERRLRHFFYNARIKNVR